MNYTFEEIATVWDSACPDMSKLIISDREFIVLWNDHLFASKDDIVAGLVEFDKNNAGDFKILNTIELNTQEIIYLFEHNNIKIYTEHEYTYKDFI